MLILLVYLKLFFNVFWSKLLEIFKVILWLEFKVLIWDWFRLKLIYLYFVENNWVKGSLI